MEDQKTLIVPSEQEIKNQWNTLSDYYEQLMERPTSILGQTVLTLIDIQNANSILEVGCGSGYLAAEILRQKNPKSKFICSDLSEEMISKTQQRLQYIVTHGFINYSELQFNDSTEFRFDNTKLLDQFNCEIQLLNNEDLSCIPDNSVDRYISILSLHLTTNPSNQLKETFRVMQQGGISSFVVWGRKSNSKIFTLVENAFIEYGQPLSQKRSNFHLSDRDELIQLFELHGFKDIVSWYQYLPMTIEQQHLFNFPTVKTPLNSVQDPELKDKIKQHVLNQVSEEVLQNKYPLGFEALLIIARK